jgi:hypothetical protein
MITHRTELESVREKGAGTVSEWRSPGKGWRETQRRVRDVSRKRSERTAVIARSGTRHRGARPKRRPREQ